MTRDEAIEMIRTAAPDACADGCDPDGLVPLSGDEWLCPACEVRLSDECSVALRAGLVTPDDVVEF